MFDDAELQPRTASATGEEAVEIWDEINARYAEKALNLVIVFPSNLGADNTKVLEIGDINPRGGFLVPEISTSHIKAGSSSWDAGAPRRAPPIDSGPRAPRGAGSDH